MGLDIALGVVVLIGAIRGWFRGFVLQAVRLGGLVGSVYLASPIRDYVRPHVVPYLAAVPASMLDRMLWWSSAVASYLIMVGLASLAVKLYRKRPYGEPEPNPADQFAGLLLAAGKSAVVGAFLIGALDQYALVWVKQVPWASEMTRGSTVLTWHEQYRPSEKIWQAAPVQHFVGQVRRMGIDGPPLVPGEALPTAGTAALQAANRTPRLDLPTLDPSSPDFTRKFDEAFRKLETP